MLCLCLLSARLQMSWHTHLALMWMMRPQTLIFAFVQALYPWSQRSTHLLSTLICWIKNLLRPFLLAYQALFTGMNFSPLLMVISSLRLRLKPKKWNMTPHSDLSVSSMILPQPKSSATVAIPSTLTSTTQRTNQVGSVSLFVVLRFWLVRFILLSLILEFSKLKNIFSCEFKCYLFGP